MGDAARLAATQNGVIDAARARVEQASARADLSRSALFPDLSAGAVQQKHTLNTATFGFSFIDPGTGRPLMRPDGEIMGPVPTIDFRYRVQAQLYNPSLWGNWRAAQAGTAAASANLDAQAEGVAAAAALSYVAAARAQAQLEARAADSALAADLLRIARDQLDAGVGVALDVTRAQSQLANVRAQIIMARNERDRTLLELKRVTGMPMDAPLELADSLAGMPVEDLPARGNAAGSVTGDAAGNAAAAAADREQRASSALSTALDKRPDLRALDALEAVQEQSGKAIRMERMPQLSLTLDHGVIGANTKRLLPTYSWGLALSMDIFDGFRRKARLEEQLAAVRETEARLRDLRAQSSLEVRSALLDLDAAREQVDAAAERLTLANQEVSQAEERFEAGVSGNADVITALLSLNQARTLRNDALAGYQMARVSLARAMGEARQLP